MSHSIQGLDAKLMYTTGNTHFNGLIKTTGMVKKHQYLHIICLGEKTCTKQVFFFYNFASKAIGWMLKLPHFHDGLESSLSDSTNLLNSFPDGLNPD